MEPERIDAIVRSLATSGSRRKALGAALGGLVGGAAGAAAADGKGDKGKGRRKDGGKGKGGPGPEQAACAGRGQNCRKVDCCAGLTCRGGTCAGTGPVFVTGPTGPTGPRGVTGTQGQQGATGPTGQRGRTGAPGAVGPTGPAGSGYTCVRVASAQVLSTSGGPPGDINYYGTVSCDEGEYAIACDFRVPPSGEVALRSIFLVPETDCEATFQIVGNASARTYPALVYAYCASLDPDCAPASQSVALGAPCTPGVDTCADPDASCTFPYNRNDTSVPSALGTYCLYPTGHGCGGNGECATNSCVGGSCSQ